MLHEARNLLDYNFRDLEDVRVKLKQCILHIKIKVMDTNQRIIKLYDSVQKIAA